MNKYSKIAVLMAMITTMGSLAACQSTVGPQERSAPHMAEDGPNDQGFMKHHKLSPEQRAQMEKHRAERQAMFAQIQKACEGKTVGQAVQVKIGEKTMDGTCEIHFKPSKMDDRMAPPAPPVPAS